MKRFPKILATTCAAIALSSSLALAAEAPRKDAPAPAPVHGLHARGGMGPMMGPLAQLSPEKQEAARKLMDEHAKAQFPLHQAMYAKNAELEALNAAGNGESAKAKAVIRDIADLSAKMLVENGRFRTRMFKETGLSVPTMGHGGMMGGMMGGKGMMGGGMKCPMMGQMGGMQHGAPAPAVPAPGAPAAPAAASEHDAHKN